MNVLKSVAAHNYEEEVKSLPIDEVIGEIIDIDLDKQAISILDITQIMFLQEMELQGDIIYSPKQIH